MEAIGNLARMEGLSNVQVLWCDLEAQNGIKIQDGSIDVGILINTFFQFEDRDLAIQEIARTMRNGSKLFVVDWSDSFGGLGPQPTQVATESDVRAHIESHGFVFERNFDSGDHHYGLAFRKA